MVAAQLKAARAEAAKAGVREAVVTADTQPAEDDG